MDSENNGSRELCKTILPVIMAGGEGSRLRPLTETTPKPLLPLDGVPVIERLLCLLADAGFEQAVITVRYRGKQIEEALGTWFRGLQLLYLHEDGDAPLGTAGSVRAAAERYLQNETDLLVLSGDAVTNADLPAFCRFHAGKSADASLLSVRVAEPSAYGTILSAPDGRITGFREKPSAPETVTDAVNTGIYLLSRRILGDIPASGAPDFGSDLFPKMLEDGRRLYVCHADCFWCDIGAFDDFLSCALAVSEGKLPGIPAGGSHVKQFPGNSIGRGCFIPADAAVRESALLGSVSVGSGASVFRSIVGTGVKIGKDASVGTGCVIGNNAVIGDRAVLPAGTRVPAGSIVPSPQTARRVFGATSVFPRAGDGYCLSRPAAETHPGDSADLLPLPDIDLCVRFGRALARYASEMKRTENTDALPVLVFLRTDEDESLAAAETFVLESARMLCGGVCRIVCVSGVTASDAARDASLASHRALSGSASLLRVIFCRLSDTSEASPSPAVILLDRFGRAFDRIREHAWERLLSDTETQKAGSGHVCIPETLPSADVMLHFHRELLSGERVPAFAPGIFPYRVDRSHGESYDLSLLSGLFAACFGQENGDAPLVLRLTRDPESGETLPEICEEADGGTVSGKWELLALWLSAQRERAVTVPVTSPLWLDEIAARTNTVLVRTPEELRSVFGASETSVRTDAPAGLRLLFSVCVLAAQAAAAERSEKEHSGYPPFSAEGTFRAFRRAVLGETAQPHVRVRRSTLPWGTEGDRVSVRVPSAASAVRRLCEEEAFVPAGEGVLSRRTDGSAVRVSQTRAHTLRITADAYSSEQAEELLSETEALLARLTETP